MSLHAHLLQVQQDCDSTYSRGYVIPMSLEELQSPYGREDLRVRVMSGIMDFSEFGTVTVTPTEVMSFTRTDEGYVRHEVTWCENEHCDTDESWFRDATAERAGY